jgi:hypothetical protein
MVKNASKKLKITKKNLYMHVIVLKKTSILPRHVAAQWGAAIWGKKTD